jgi:phytoene dehydrogenase-like protein
VTDRNTRYDSGLAVVLCGEIENRAMADARVAVAGGGLAGLVAARHLADAGADVTVFERNAEVGGRVRSTREDGFVFDRGFQVLFTAYPAVRRELRVGDLDFRRFSPGACIATPGNRAILSDPFRDPRALTESLFNTRVGTGDKLRTLLLRRSASKRDWDAIPGESETTIREFLERKGFSERFVENFAAPFYGGITLDRSLSTASRVFEYTFKALSTGRIGVPADGMGAIPRQLRENAEVSGATVETGTTVEAVDPGDGVVELDADGTAEFDAVVVATDPKSATELASLESIPTEARSCVTQHYAYDGELDVGKRIVLNAADDRPNQVVPMSAAAPEYAPEDSTLLVATFLGDQDESDEELAAETRSALASWFPERSFGGLEPLHTDRIEFAQFDQPLGVHDSLPDARDPEGSVYLAGDYTRWSSIQGAMASGRDAARAVNADLDLGL